MKDRIEDEPVDFVQGRDVLGLPIKPIPIPDTDEEIKSENIDTALLAGFSERIIAAFIDTVIATIVSIIINSSLFNEIPKDSILFGILNSLYHTVYFAWFESSFLQATPGKIIMKIKVMKRGGQQISFMRGVGRYWAKIISISVLFLGVISIFINEERQGWHDMLANTLVIKDKL
ncbi:MAG: RDD family protein [Bacteroidia bacterium]